MTVPNVGETLSGYTDLPVNGIVNATNGDKLAVAELDENDKVMKFGQTTAVVVAEPVGGSGERRQNANYGCTCRSDGS